MYEFHGWFGLAESASEADSGQLVPKIGEVQGVLDRFVPPFSSAELRAFNGEYFLWVNGLTNRPRDEALALDDLLEKIAKRMQGSWGIVYDRSDDWSESPLANAFRVRVLARGVVTVREDPFLSPCRPTIED